MHKVQIIQDKCHLPSEREESRRVTSIPPHKATNPPEVKLDLKNREINKTSDILVLKEEAEDTIQEYPSDWIHVYTDGSAFEATVKAG